MLAASTAQKESHQDVMDNSASRFTGVGVVNIPRAILIEATTQAHHLRRWLSAVENFYAGRILAFGVEEARQAGLILDRARAHDPGFEDIAIAATAVAHGLTVLSANERHFAPLGVPFVNPLRTLPTMQ